MPRLSRSIVLALAACWCGACTSRHPQADSARASKAAVSMSMMVPESVWVVTPRGIGPLRVGMTRGEVEAVLGGLVPAPGDSGWRPCAFIAPADSGRVATAEGAQVGDSEAHIIDLYNTAVATPLEYSSGHTLTVMPTVEYVEGCR